MFDYPVSLSIIRINRNNGGTCWKRSNPQKNEINYLQTNNLEKLNRVKREEENSCIGFVAQSIAKESLKQGGAGILMGSALLATQLLGE
ncbi:hypothetical protein [Spiroplasma endosymbiont of 'Nebria riversi']|uniref:hypothetical protein n=1 Tax=Spiroplasma endosymbiont of 'Nebria riversi' TaxID=2792084 RepID=UPI001C04B827|nr:hypothetical protein [Spiroplasma endosymbiont of 'Nebria riversi']